MKESTKAYLVDIYNSIPKKTKATCLKFYYQYHNVNVNVYFDAFDNQSVVLSIVLSAKKKYYYTPLNILNTGMITEYLSEIPPQILEKILVDNHLDDFYENMEKHLLEDKPHFNYYNEDTYFVNTIKYAKSKGYNRIIQFDADGQHIAKEAKKLIEKMDETDADIVIGSRFLEKGTYKQTFFRKLGTNIFSFLIKVFCKEKISDPTSGFQCLGEKAIDRFSTFGMYPEFPDANLIIELLYSGFKIEEIPVNMRLREFGESMHGGILKPIKYMISVLYTISIIILRNIFRRRGAK